MKAKTFQRQFRVSGYLMGMHCITASFFKINKLVFQMLTNATRLSRCTTVTRMRSALTRPLALTALATQDTKAMALGALVRNLLTYSAYIIIKTSIRFASLVIFLNKRQSLYRHPRSSF